LIQTTLKQADSGIAGVAFSGDAGDELMTILRKEFRRYLELERSAHSR